MWKSVFTNISLVIDIGKNTIEQKMELYDTHTQPLWHATSDIDYWLFEIIISYILLTIRPVTLKPFKSDSSNSIT